MDQWLERQPEPRRLGYAIEFLLQWIGYADERADVDECDAIRAARVSTLDVHESIKRRVYDEATADFVACLTWITGRIDADRRRQAFDLLALLSLDEGRPTPVRNTLLRFLVDAFGLGSGYLMQHCNTVYHRPLERLPRPDLDDWWDEWESSDTRPLQPDRLQRLWRDRLALPLESELDFAAVEEAYQRLSALCARERFARLGAREQGLARWQQARFTEARDALVETLR